MKTLNNFATKVLYLERKGWWVTKNSEVQLLFSIIIRKKYLSWMTPTILLLELNCVFETFRFSELISFY